MADPQRLKVYSWEVMFRQFNEHNVPRRTLRQLIRKAERRYRVPHTRVSFSNRVHRAKRFAKVASDYDPEEHAITLGWKDHNYAIALHETAHAITDHLLGRDLPGHGAQWLGVYLWLLEWAQIAPRDALHASAKAAGLKWSPAGKVGPDAIRLHYRGMIERAAEEG
mgnify:CR=1 FL=1